MARSAAEKEADGHTMIANKIYHWAKNKKGKLTLHPGMKNKCRRHHYVDR